MLKNDELQTRERGGGVEPVKRMRQPAPEQPRQPRQPIKSKSGSTTLMRLLKRLFFGLALLLVVLGIYRVKQTQEAAAAKKQAAVIPPVPVIAGAVAMKDVPIYLDGLGTVQALNTVTVHTRVDGQLVKVAFTEGQDVKEGDLLAQIDPAPFQAALGQAVAKKGQDVAQLANANLDLTRDADMFAKKVISSQQLDTQKALVAQLAATVKADQAGIDSAQVQLDYTNIVSPIAGRTGIRLVDQGNIVHAADTGGLVVITQLRPISLLFTLPEQNLADIHKRTAAGEEMTVLAVDRDNQTVIDEGTLSVINNQIDTTTGTIQLKATFPNKNLQLWPGQFVNARLHLTTRKSGLVVPASVIQRGPNGPYAFVIKADQTVEIRPVKTTKADANDVLIESGLKVGEKVVVDGQYKLQDGSAVKIGDKNAVKHTESGSELK
jgi:multidrug efflux system membrane fusion protein